MAKKNKDEKWKPDVKVETLPNGYALTVCGHEYLYLSPMKLLAGVFYHVGLKNLNEVNSDNIQCLMEAVMSWPTVKDAATSQTKMQADLNDARRELRISRKQYHNLSEKHKFAQDELTDLRGKLYIATKRLAANDDLQIRLDKANDALKKTDREIVKLEHRLNDERQEVATLKRDKAALLAKLADSSPDIIKNGKKRSTTPPKKNKRATSRKMADALIIEQMNQQAQPDK